MTTYRIGNHVYFLGMVEARSVNVTNTTITTTTTTVRRRSAGKDWMCLYFSIHKAVSRDAPGLFPRGLLVFTLRMGEVRNGDQKVRKYLFSEIPYGRQAVFYEDFFSRIIWVGGVKKFP